MNNNNNHNNNNKNNDHNNNNNNNNHNVIYFDYFGVEHILKEIKTFINNKNILTIKTLKQIFFGYKNMIQ